MDTGTKDKSDEAADHWKRIVEAIWTLNYISAGFKGFMPRAHAMPPSLDDLQSLIPAIKQKSTADILERELRETLSQFRQAAELLADGVERINGLLSQLEQQRARLDEP